MDKIKVLDWVTYVIWFNLVLSSICRFFNYISVGQYLVILALNIIAYWHFYGVKERIKKYREIDQIRQNIKEVR